MSVEIKNNGNSVTIGNAEYPTGQYKLEYGTNDVTITPLFSNLRGNVINLSLDNIVDDSGDPLADMDALKAYLSTVFYGEVEAE